MEKDSRLAAPHSLPARFCCNMSKDSLDPVSYCPPEPCSMGFIRAPTKFFGIRIASVVVFRLYLEALTSFLFRCLSHGVSIGTGCVQEGNLPQSERASRDDKC